jgi:hypothetical protein
VHPNGWLFYKFTPEELERLQCAACEPKELQILRETRHSCTVELQICGAFPLDVAWPYYIVIRIGRIANMEDFQISIRLTDTVRTNFDCSIYFFC